MKTKLLILPICILFLNASIFAFYQSTEEDLIPMQKSNPTKEEKKKPEKEERDAKDESDKESKDAKDKSLKDKVKEKLKKDKEKKEGGRFGDRRY